jgi:hypothetical protein
LEESRVETLQHRSPEVAKCETPKSLGVGGVKETHDKNDEIAKCKTMTFRSFGYRKLEESRVETLHHSSPEVEKCETLKSRNKHINKDSISEFRRPGNQRFRIPGIGGAKSRYSSSQESRSCEIRNVKILKQAHQQRLHFEVLQTGKSKVSDTGSWRSQESRLFITRVLKLGNAKRQNLETGTTKAHEFVK